MTIGMRSGAGVMAAAVQLVMNVMMAAVQPLEGAMMAVRQMAAAPVEQLRSYYSRVLERELNTRQTWLLVNAQLAFAFAVLPVESPLLLRAACCGWFLHAVLRCRETL